MVESSSIKATIFMGCLHWGHSSGSTSYIFLISLFSLRSMQALPSAAPCSCYCTSRNTARSVHLYQGCADSRTQENPVVDMYESRPSPDRRPAGFPGHMLIVQGIQGG